MSCSRTQEYLASHGIAQPAKTIDARKSPIERSEALALAKQAEEIVACKGKKISRLQGPQASEAELAAAILGPTGNLRAPALCIGRTLIVGFDEATYENYLRK